MTHAESIENHSLSTVATDATVADPQEEPFPPRYWWLRRIVAGVGLLLVGLVLLRIWWGWETNRRLQAEIDSYIAAGEPVYPEDFDPPEDIPDDRNAAKFLMDAADAMTLTPEQATLIGEVASEPETAAEHLAELTTIVSANRRVLELVRKARSLEQADWGIRFAPSPFNATIQFGYLSGHRQVSNLLASAAMRAHLIGDDDEAIAILRDSLRLSRAQDGHPTLIHHLVAVACRALVAETTRVIAPDLTIDHDGEQGIGQSGAASRRDVQALTEALFVSENDRNAIVRLFRAERLGFMDLAGQLTHGEIAFGRMTGMGTARSPTVSERLLALPLHPAWIVDATRMLRRTSAHATAAGRSTWPAARVMFIEGESDFPAWDHLLRPFTHPLFSFSYERSIELHFRGLVLNSMAATALAIRLYQVDNGHRPTSLTELVPAYLPSIPLDPFAEGDQPLRYVTDGDAPRLYSIGSDGVDDGGMTAVRASGRFNLDRLDLVFPLAGKRPTAPSAP